jgi:hypothetical protein
MVLFWLSLMVEGPPHCPSPLADACEGLGVAMTNEDIVLTPNTQMSISARKIAPTFKRLFRLEVSSN